MQFDLVFEGGGAKGIVFVGALQELERRGHTFGRLLGTSAGAIMATFTAAGFSVDEMLAALSEKDDNGVPVFQQFLGQPRPFTPDEVANSVTREILRHIDLRLLPNFIEDRLDNLVLRLMTQEELINMFSFVERGGWYSADAFVNWAMAKLDQTSPEGLERNLSEKTFAEFHQITGRELSLVAADITGQRMLVLNRRTAPQLPVVWGMRMSMSLPLLWQEVLWKREWGTYLNNPMEGHRIVDGGILSNFPIELFLSNAPHVLSIMGSRTGKSVLGLLIDESLKVTGVQDTVARSGGLVDLSPVARITGLIDTAAHAHDKMVIEAFEQFVCRLPAKSYRTTEFDMTDERRRLLIAAGRSAIDDYFRNRETEGMKGPNVFEMEKALKRADGIALNILQ